MKSQRLTRVNELLRREVAALLFREMAGASFDASRVTITRAQISANLRHARIGVSVRGDEPEVRKVFALLTRRRVGLQRRLHEHVILKYTPVLHFERDESIAEGDRILHLLDELPPSPSGENEPET